jgi:hypothetical protein
MMSPDAHAQMMGGIWGFVLGGVAAMLVGFQLAGWTTASTVQKMNDEAVLASRAAICVSQFKNAPNYKANIKEFSAAESYKKSELVEKGGWDKMPGQESASWGVAGACVAGLEAAVKAGT